MKLEFECTRTWDSLQGEEQRRRHCDDCDKHVYNLSGMTRGQARRLLALYGDKPPCVHFVSQNGEILHEGDPLAQLRRQRAGIAALVGAALSVQVAFVALADDPSEAWFDPFAAIAGALDSSSSRGFATTGVVAPHDRYLDDIAFSESDFDCLGREACKAGAIKAYDQAAALAKVDAPDTQYAVFERLSWASETLARGGFDEAPAPIEDLEEKLTLAKSDVEGSFKAHRVNFHNYEKRKMFGKMRTTVETLQAEVPDRRALYNQWAVEKERKMKDDGVWPITPDATD